MKRLKMPPDLVLLQVDYLVGLGIHYIELVSGDDIGVVRDTLPDLVRGTREIFEKHGVRGKVNFCTLALTEGQYAALRHAGGDAMIVWQEAYDPEVYRRHIVAGPKHSGLDDNWKWNGDNGWLFRIQSQERAMRAGVEVALGTMLGLNSDMVTEFLAVVEHARVLRERYGATPEHPITIGMPIWNPITTPGTDKRPGGTMSAVDLFPTLAALYLLALPWDGIWVFPNCRVPLEVQIEAVRVAGAFTSTEVKLGPGGYLPALIRHARQQGEDTSQLRERVAKLLREGGTGEAELAQALDEREQFVHHYHEHRVYRDALERAGLQVTNGVQIPAGGAAVA
jgi:2-iminoacetate synthase ThiH